MDLVKELSDIVYECLKNTFNDDYSDIINELDDFDADTWSCEMKHDMSDYDKKDVGYVFMKKLYTGNKEIWRNISKSLVNDNHKEIAESIDKCFKL